MPKKKVLFAVHQLNIGGVQKSLIQALNAVDYNENEVTLYIRKNRVDFLSEVNPAVSEIIINNDKTVYYRKPFAILLQILTTVFGIFRLKKTNTLISPFLIFSITTQSLSPILLTPTGKYCSIIQVRTKSTKCTHVFLKSMTTLSPSTKM